MTWQGVSEAECYDNRSVMAQIMRLKDRVRALEEEGSEEIEHEIELINEELAILEVKYNTLEEGAASLAEDVAALETGKADNDAVVKLTGNQTIMDVKSFIRSPIVPTPTANGEAATKKYVDDKSHEYTAGLGLSINDDVIGINQDYADDIVKKTGNQQTISSLIIFNTLPHAPGTPTGASDVANKAYVDSVAGGGGGGGTYTAGTGLQLVGTEFSLDSATQTAVAAVSGKADDNAVVKLSGAQTVAGVKTFSDSPIVPTPTTDYQVATKKYVDDNAGGSGSGPWTTLPAADFGSTGLALLFDDTGTERIAKKDIMVYVGTATASDNDGKFSQFIPKGTIVPAYYSERYETAIGTNFYNWMSMRFNLNVLLKVEAPTTNNVNLALVHVVSGSSATNSITRITGTNITIEPTTTPYDLTGVGSGRINVCIQYR